MRLGWLPVGVCVAAVANAAVGDARAVRECSTCHPAQAKPHPATSMAHAAETVAECRILKSHPLLTFRSEIFSYRIERKGDQSIYSVTDGKDTFTVPLGWALGLGDAGQTYVYQNNGKLYESFVSYYTKPDKLDITMGDQKLRPRNLADAAGRLLGKREAPLCFSCHTTDSGSSTELHLDTAIPGVQCERCHGRAGKHLQGLKAGDASLAAMKKLGSMSAEETSDFCGQCHRTWEQIAMNGPHGVGNVRFQPYRLANSKCYDVDDRRISCVACHDPHKESDRVSVHYDPACQACHGGGKPGAKSCKVASRDCVSCHMPKVALPGAHHEFTDHDIRIARANEPYPD